MKSYDGPIISRRPLGLGPLADRPKTALRPCLREGWGVLPLGTGGPLRDDWWGPAGQLATTAK